MVGGPNGVDRVSCQAVIGHEAEAKSKQAPVGILLSLEWLLMFWLPGDSGLRQPFLLPNTRESHLTIIATEVH